MRALQKATFATWVATGIALATPPGIAAQTAPNFPTKPVRMIIPFTAGSATDLKQISREIARIVELPDIKKQFVIQGEEGRSNTPEEFSRFVRDEIEKYSKLVKQAGIRIE